MEVNQYSFENILNSVLSRIPDDVDKREGSIIYDAVAPCCYELAEMYLNLGVMQSNISSATATGDHLTEIAYQNGTFRKPAVKALRKAVIEGSAPIGTRFTIQGVNYVSINQINATEQTLQAEEAGEIGNAYSGPLIPLTYINTLVSATLTTIISPGADEESDESLRERYRSNITNPPQDGNISQYLDWANNFEGIGAAKVFPLWNGGNTVKIAVTNAIFLPADPTLVDKFQEYLDPSSAGLGNGKAPIGSKVTVVGGTKKDINITANVVLTEGYQTPEGVAEAVSDYLASVTYKKDTVSYIRVGNAILDCPSIVDMNGLTINGLSADVTLVGDEIPVLNSINLPVVN